MNITERLNALRHLNRHSCDEHERPNRGCCAAGEIEEHLDAIQAEVEELLKRIPAQPDTVPAHITLTAS